jgi:N-acetylglucosaminyldiphosphoundecaprenol N-acetyl-beta-D-mannosaminyltransferase
MLSSECVDREEAVSDPIWVWGVPITPLTLGETVAAVSKLIAAREPAYFITANTHYAMLTAENPDLSSINQQAAFIVADGAPLVWASRWRGQPLPERIAGSDLIFELCAKSAQEGYRVFFFGGAAGVAEEAAERLQMRYPKLQVAGTASPPFGDLTSEEQASLIDRIRAAHPDLLIAAYTMPRGERWLAANLSAVGVPVGVNLGAAIDFAAGRFCRAPRWMQKTGLEWAFRLALEPKRLYARYARNAWFILRMIIRDLLQASWRSEVLHSVPSGKTPSSQQATAP